MKLRRASSLSALLGLSVVAAGGASATVPAHGPSSGLQCTPTWTLAPISPPSLDQNNIEALEVISENDVWAVGSYLGTSQLHAMTEHWDGPTWTNISNPSAGQLASVSAVAASDVWAVGTDATGNGGLILHYDGTAWKVSSHPGPSAPYYFTGVEAIAPSDVWAVGLATSPAPGTVAEHWDGTKWHLVTTPTQSGDYSFDSISGISSDDIWAVGTDFTAFAPLTEHWNGTSWTRVSFPSQPYATYLNGVSEVSSSDVWVVGSRPGPFAAHWDGTQWLSVPAAGGGGLFDVTAVSAEDVWAVGSNGQNGPQVTHWDGEAWSTVGDVAPSTQILYAVAASPEGAVWGGGGGGATPTVEVLCEADVTDSAIQPRRASLPFGDGVAWRFDPTNGVSHELLDPSALHLFDSGLRSPGGSFSFTFFGAGKYDASDPVLGKSFTISVLPTASPPSGGTGTKFTISWAIEFPPGGYRYQAQIMRPGSSTWSQWTTTFSSSQAFVPDAGTGTYSFRARIQSASHSVSLWSPSVSILVT